MLHVESTTTSVTRESASVTCNSTKTTCTLEHTSITRVTLVSEKTPADGICVSRSFCKTQADFDECTKDDDQEDDQDDVPVATPAGVTSLVSVLKENRRKNLGKERQLILAPAPVEDVKWRPVPVEIDDSKSLHATTLVDLVGQIVSRGTDDDEELRGFVQWASDLTQSMEQTTSQSLQAIMRFFSLHTAMFVDPYEQNIRTIILSSPMLKGYPFDMFAWFEDDYDWHRENYPEQQAMYWILFEADSGIAHRWHNCMIRCFTAALLFRWITVIHYFIINGHIGTYDIRYCLYMATVLCDDILKRQPQPCMFNTGLFLDISLVF